MSAQTSGKGRNRKRILIDQVVKLNDDLPQYAVLSKRYEERKKMHLENEERVKAFHDSLDLFSDERTEVDVHNDPVYELLNQLVDFKEEDVNKRRSQNLVSLKRKIIENYDSMDSEIQELDHFLDQEFNKLNVEFSNASPE
jgi:hypothetical protein